MLRNLIVNGLLASWYRLHISIDDAKDLFLPGNGSLLPGDFFTLCFVK